MQQDRLAPRKRAQWFEQQRAYPNVHIPTGAYWLAQQQRNALITKHSAKFAGLSPELISAADPLSSAIWTPDGPDPLAFCAGCTPWSGAATSIAVDPTNPMTVYLGTSGGGVWKTTDGGGTWTPLTDSQASLAIGAVAVDPNNPSTIYAGTGGFADVEYMSVGLLKSTDGGATWALIQAPFTNSSFSTSNGGVFTAFFNQIAVQQGNSNVILAATFGGLYRSQDGGQTWTIVLSPESYSTDVQSVMFDTKNPTIAYAGLAYNSAGIVYKSTDSGATWNSISGTGSNVLPAGSSNPNVALAEDAGGTTLYAAVSAPYSGATNDAQPPGSIFKTTDGGVNWTNLGPPTQGQGEGCNFYTCAIAVDPVNPNVLYTSGVLAFVSTDGGKTWAGEEYGKASTDGGNTFTLIPGSAGPYADQHAFAFAPDGSRMYLADDGGIFVTADPADATPIFASLNQTLNTMTFYPGFSISETPEAELLAGSQDHGLDIYEGNPSWNEVGMCGDGGAAYMDSQGINAYGHCPGGLFLIATPINDISGFWNEADIGINPDGTDAVPWVADIKGDWQNPEIIYTGTNYLYQTMDFAQSWTRISPNLSPNAVISTIAVSPLDSNSVYVGTADAQLSVTHTALSGNSATWTTLSGLPNRSLTKVLTLPDSSNDVYATTSGFSTGHVFHSTDGGSTWTDISGNLPDMPVNGIVVDPDVMNTIYLATDTGVYFTENGGTNWSVLGTGLPNVVVTDILMDEPTRTLHVVTYGRGAWETIVPLMGLQASSARLEFSDQNVGTTSSAQTIVLTNNQSSASVNLSGLQITGPFSQSNTCGGSLTAGASCTVSLTFSPTSAGNMQGVLTIGSSTNTVVVLLSGTGAAPEIALSPASLNFGNQAIGTQSNPQFIGITSVGTSALNNISCVITGANVSDFVVTGCPTSLLAGSSSSAGVAFVPTASGTRIATLTISDNAPDSPQSVPLSGNGGGTSKATPMVIVSPSLWSVSTTQNLLVTVSVTGGSGSPLATGSVVLAGGGFTSTSAGLNGNTVTIEIPSGSLNTGTVILTAAYTPDASASANYNGSTGSATVVVSNSAKATPFVTAIPSSSTISAAQGLTMAVTVSGGSGNPTPTGNVILTSGTYTSTAVALTGGTLSIPVPAGFLTAGTDTIEAIYTPDTSSASTYNSAVGGATVKVTPVKSVPAVTVYLSAQTITTNQQLAITVVVSSGPSNPLPTGTVTLARDRLLPPVPT